MSPMKPALRFDTPVASSTPVAQPEFFALLAPLVDESSARLATVLAPGRIRGEPLLHGFEIYLRRKLSEVAGACVATELARERRRVQIAIDAGRIDRIEFASRIAALHAEFVEGQLGSEAGRALFFAVYPTLRATLDGIAAKATAAAIEFAERLILDWEALNPGPDAVALRGCEFGLSDPHEGHRTVAIVTFSSGRKIVYKPRSCAIDTAFADFAAWLASQPQDGDEFSLQVAGCLAREGYGWVEFIEAQRCRDTAELAAFARHSGMFAAALYFLCATDFHRENVIARGEYPVGIDLECLVVLAGHTVPSQAGTAPDFWPVGSSLLSSGYLPYWRSGATDRLPCGDSGLTGPNGRRPAFESRVWLDVGQSTFRAGWAFPKAVAVSGNLPCEVALDREPGQSWIDDHLEDLLAGFRGAYRFILRNRDLLDSPNGPLSRFQGVATRCIVRDTTVYHRVLQQLATPAYLRSSAAFAEGLRSLPAEVGKVHGEAIVEEEVRHLSAFDIPIFHAATDARGLSLPGGGTAQISQEPPSSSGLEHVRVRLATASEADLQRQCGLIRASLYGWAEGQVRIPLSDTDDPHTIQTDCIQAARLIAWELERQAVRGASGAYWIQVVRPTPGQPDTGYGSTGHSLYCGSAGTAVFLANLFAVTHETRWKVLAIEALRYARGLLQTLAVKQSAFGGSYSVVYCHVECARLLGEEQLLDEAVQLSASAAGLPIGATDDPTLLTGSAGSLLVLMHLARVRTVAGLWDRVHALGDLLLCHSPDARTIGMARGAAGIGLALHRLGAVLGRRDCLAAADGCIADATTAAGNAGWSTGAAGIGLARLAQLQQSLDQGSDRAVLKAGVDLALEAVERRSADASQHLYDGEAAAIVFLAEAGQALGRADLKQLAAGSLQAMFRSANERGHWMLESGAERMSCPGLMNGVAGIGLAALTVAAPGTVSKVLTLQ